MPKTSIKDFFGSLVKPGTRPLMLDEIAEIAAEGWSGGENKTKNLNSTKSSRCPGEDPNPNTGR